MIHRLETRLLLDATLDGNGLLTVNGTSGDDTITVSLNAGNISVSNDPDLFPLPSVTGILVLAGDGSDRVTIIDAVLIGVQVQAGTGNDTITGGGGADDLRGEDGDDLLDGGRGADSLAGDAGLDTVTYASRTAALTLTLDNTANDGEAGENDVLDDSVDILIGGRGDDAMSSVGQIDPRALYGGPGNDTLTAGAGDTRLNGGFGDDMLTGGAGNNALVAGFGRDTLSGGGGTDGVTYYYAPVAVTVNPNGQPVSGVTGEGDTVNDDIETIVGSPFGDMLLSSPTFANFIKGLGGNDTITASGGGDTLWGGDGNDNLVGSNGVADVIDGGRGTDTADSDAALDTITGVP